MAQGDGEEIELHQALTAELIRAHNVILGTSGGMPGVHASLLSSAVARPFTTFDGKPLYRTPYERAASLFYGLICDHVFVDGNKRTATVGAFIYLASIENQMTATQPTSLQVRLLGEVAIETALGNLSVEDVAYWLERILGPSR